MPTAAKLAAAVLFAVLSWVVADIFARALPPEIHSRLLRPVAAAIGVLFGWRVSGRLVGRGMTEAATNGLRTVATIAFATDFVFSTYDMVMRAFKKAYDSPMQAVLDIFSIMLVYGRMMLRTDVIATMIVGGLICGLITEWISRRWR